MKMLTLLELIVAWAFTLLVPWALCVFLAKEGSMRAEQIAVVSATLLWFLGPIFGKFINVQD